MGSQIAVEFHHGDCSTALQQRLCECAQAGADLDEMIAAFRRDRADDLVNQALIDEEMLAEAFAGDMFQTMPANWDGKLTGSEQIGSRIRMLWRRSAQLTAAALASQHTREPAHLAPR
jgi:hypothetical protein